MIYTEMYRELLLERLKRENPEKAKELQRRYDAGEEQRINNLIAIAQIKRDRDRKRP